MRSTALFIALLLSSAEIRAQEPTGYIPAAKATVTAVKFFESPPPPNVTPRERRAYSNRFPKSQVRQIFWELNLEHPAPGRRVNFIIEAVWYSPTSTGEGARRSMQASIQRDWTWSYWHDGAEVIGQWKHLEPSTGRTWKSQEPWPVGPYRVDFYVAGAKVAAGSFEIAGDKPSAGGSPSPRISENEKAAEAAYKEADRLTDKLKFREALPYLDKAIQLDPNLLMAYALRGYSYNALADLDEKPEYKRRALEDYNTAIQRDLKDGVRRSGWYNNRGGIYMGMEDNQRALKDFDEAIRIDAKYVSAISNRGELRRKMGDLDGSIADLTRAIELQSKNGSLYCQRGLTWLRKAKDSEAQSDFRRCSELDPKTREDYTKHMNKILEERKRKF